MGGRWRERERVVSNVGEKKVKKEKEQRVREGNTNYLIAEGGMVVNVLSFYTVGHPLTIYFVHIFKKELLDIILRQFQSCWHSIGCFDSSCDITYRN